MYTEGNTKEVNRYFYDQSNAISVEAYIDFLLAQYCMPTLLWLKPSNLININKKFLKDRMNFLTALEREVKNYRIRSTIIYENERILIMLIFNKELLCKVIHGEEEAHFLKACGYQLPVWSEEDIIYRLKNKYFRYMEINNSGTVYPSDLSCSKRKATGRSKAYPHEIGILLGYPVCDVEDFIKYEGKHYILCGCWKVYHNQQKAQETFERFKEIRKTAMNGIRDGKSLKNVVEEILLSTGMNEGNGKKPH